MKYDQETIDRIYLLLETKKKIKVSSPHPNSHKKKRKKTKFKFSVGVSHDSGQGGEGGSRVTTTQDRNGCRRCLLVGFLVVAWGQA